MKTLLVESCGDYLFIKAPLPLLTFFTSYFPLHTVSIRRNCFTARCYQYTDVSSFIKSFACLFGEI